MPDPTHAYLSIRDGKVTGLAVDYADPDTASWIAEVISEGGFVERVTLEEARDTPLLEPWRGRKS